MVISKVKTFSPNYTINVIDILMLAIMTVVTISFKHVKSNRKAMNRNWSNQKANPALKTKALLKPEREINKYYK